MRFLSWAGKLSIYCLVIDVPLERDLCWFQAICGFQIEELMRNHLKIQLISLVSLKPLRNLYPSFISSLYLRLKACGLCLSEVLIPYCLCFTLVDRVPDKG